MVDKSSRGLVALVLAAGVALSVVILSVAIAWALIDRKNTVPEEVAGLLTTAFGALIGALSVYLGIRAGLAETHGTDDETTQRATEIGVSRSGPPTIPGAD